MAALFSKSKHTAFFRDSVCLERNRDNYKVNKHKQNDDSRWRRQIGKALCICSLNEPMILTAIAITHGLLESWIIIEHELWFRADSFIYLRGNVRSLQPGNINKR